MKALVIKLLTSFGPDFLTFLLEYIIGLLKEDKKSPVAQRSVDEVKEIVKRNGTEKINVYRKRFGR